MYLQKLSFATTYRTEPIPDEYTKVFQKAFLINKEYFQKRPPRFNIIICDSEVEIQKASKYYYHKWIAATVLRDLTLVTRSPDFLKKLNRAGNFQQLMNHEMNHVFWTHLFGTQAVWLLEGLACAIGKNFSLSTKELKAMLKKHRVDQNIVEYRYLKKNFMQGHEPRYPIWQAFTEHLIYRYSRAHLKKFISLFSRNPSKPHYKKSFESVFGSSDRELFKQWTKTI